MKYYPICVPSYKRGYYYTLKYFNNSELKIYCYVDKEDYYASGYDKIKSNNIEFVFGPRFISEKRNFIMDDQLKRENDKIFMIDDDMCDFVLFEPQEKYNRKIKISPVEYISKWQSELLSNQETVYSGVGYSNYGWASQNLGGILNLFIDGCFFMNIKVLKNNNIFFKDLLWENLDISIQIMEKRLPPPIKYNSLGRASYFDKRNISVIFGDSKERLKGIDLFNKNMYKEWGDLIKIKRNGCAGLNYKAVLNYERDNNDKYIKVYKKYPELLI
jgi:hypothetical protein